MALAVTRKRIVVLSWLFQSVPAFQTIRLLRPCETFAPKSPLSAAAGTAKVVPPLEDACKLT